MATKIDKAVFPAKQKFTAYQFILYLYHKHKPKFFVEGHFQFKCYLKCFGK